VVFTQARWDNRLALISGSVALSQLLQLLKMTPEHARAQMSE